MADLPIWCETLEMAALWHIPPWQVETDASEAWHIRAAVYERAKADRRATIEDGLK